MANRIDEIQAEIEKLDGERQAVRAKMIALRKEMDGILAKASAERKLATFSDEERKALGLPAAVAVNVKPGPANLSAEGHGG